MTLRGHIHTLSGLRPTLERSGARGNDADIFTKQFGTRLLPHARGKRL